MLSPLPEFPWARVTDMCVNTVTPVYRVIRSTLHDDMEQLAFILAERNPPRIEDADAQVLSEALPSRTADEIARATRPERPLRKKRRSSADTSAVTIIPGANPSIPTIVITLCPSQPREPACLVPYQDASFGNRLTVPTHHALNRVFPPLVAKPCPSVEHWRYENGHWCALLPDLEEQVKRRLFSRPISTRRRRAWLHSRPPPVLLSLASAVQA
ncbi:hypothetical protein BKA93DRAFT_727008 [Sparassis latifolia]